MLGEFRNKGSPCHTVTSPRLGSGCSLCFARRYIVSSKIEGGPDDYVFVYYRGRNDAWTGYGGAVVYTRAKTIPDRFLPEIKEAAKRVGLDYRYERLSRWVSMLRDSLRIRSMRALSVSRSFEGPVWSIQSVLCFQLCGTYS